MSDELTVLKEENERFKAIIDILLKQNQQLQAKLSQLFEEDRNTNFNSSAPGSYAGNINSFSSSPNSNVGNINFFTSLQSSNAGNKNSFTSSPNNRVGKLNINTSFLAQFLRKEMNTSRYIGLQNATKLLIHLHTEPHNTHKHLASLTGMTLSGLAKHIHMLKKRGLIVRQGFQTYVLTPKALAYIQQSAQQVEEGAVNTLPTT